MARKNDSAAPADAGEVTVPDPGRGRSRMLFVLAMIPLAFVSLAAGAWISYAFYPVVDYLVGSHPEAEEAEEAAHAEEAGGKKGKKGKNDGEIVYGEFKELANIIINPAGSNGQRFLLLNLGLESSSPEVMEELKAKEIVVRDTVLRVLGQRTVAELASVEQRDAAKQAVQQAINGVLSHGEVDRIYFTQYVLQ